MTDIYTKQALTYDRQISLLIKRGMDIENRSECIRCLSTINYYRLSAYSYPFRVKVGNKITDNFRKDTTFNKIIKMYEFDRRLRLLLIDAIERIEVAIRTRIAYQLSHNYGAFAHVDSNNLHANFKHNEWTLQLHKETIRASDEFVSHYKNKYSDFPNLPIWMATEIMTLGGLSKLYFGLKTDDKKSISSTLNMHHKQLSDWLHVLTYVRNVCSHHSRIWNRELAIKTQIPKSSKWNTPEPINNKRIFFVILIIKSMLKDMGFNDDWKNNCDDLLSPIVENELWQKAMGLPTEWANHPLWI